MAIYSMNLKTMSRANGHSSVSAAAYRSGEKLLDQRTGESHDYSRRSGLEISFIVFPENSPEWIQNREIVWNQAEASETRKNSTVAREIRIALPHEFNAEQREMAAREFSLNISEKYKIVCDVAIHKPDKHGDERNFHAHILMTTRRVDKDGFGEKTRELDSRQQGPQEIKFMRLEWERVVNRNLEKAGHGIRIDCRSYEDQGADKEPTIHIGKDATQLERRGLLTEVGDKNRQIRERNRERAALEMDRELAMAEIDGIDYEISQVGARLETESQLQEEQPTAQGKDQEAAVERSMPNNHDDALAILIKIQGSPLLKLERDVAYRIFSLMQYYYEPGPGIKSGIAIERDEIHTLKGELDQNKKWLSNADDNLAALKARVEKEEAGARPVIEEAKRRRERMSPKERGLFKPGGELQGIGSRDDLTRKQKIFLSENVKGYIGLERRVGHLEQAASAAKREYDQARKLPAELPARIEKLQRKIDLMEKRLKVVGTPAIRETWETIRRELQAGKSQPGQEPLILPEPERGEDKKRERHQSKGHGMGR